MRFSKSGFFMNPYYLLPRFTPSNIFENIFVFAEIFTKVVFFQINFRVTIPGNCTISRFCYPEIYQFPSIVARKLRNFQVTLPGNCSISGYCYPEVALKKYYFREYLGENESIFENI